MSNVTELAEKYRLQLGLRPWQEQEIWAEELRKEQRDRMSPEAYEAYKGRQSGRTTQGLLQTIARAVSIGCEVVTVKGGYHNSRGVFGQQSS